MHYVQNFKNGDHHHHHHHNNNNNKNHDNNHSDQKPATSNINNFRKKIGRKQNTPLLPTPCITPSRPRSKGGKA